MTLLSGSLFLEKMTPVLEIYSVRDKPFMNTKNTLAQMLSLLNQLLIQQSILRYMRRKLEIFY